ncbi:conserved hypothetical protein [Culex quinquefasciatus]|uniref:SH2 domain-containing protein n=1 Tax=Culex quinquefasciatus TaxID=7176 RepID=B0W5V9_CULQU|nr:conserved hypothetical protein [Culex quinquefasciatus]|eukprot:XP_001844093.1 conserved hypothetical protein [Culex quinquefasciatus]
MCFCSSQCCVKVSLNLLVNLLRRISDDIMEAIHCQRPPTVDDVTSEDRYQCQRYESDQQFETVQPFGGNDQPDDRRLQLEMSLQEVADAADVTELGVDCNEKGVDPPKRSAIATRLYCVIYDTVELEPYFCNVDREQCERMLEGGRDGVCIVRPFKLKHTHIRYILSVRAAGSHFHLFIRRAGPNGLQYALGLQKHRERLFRFPADIVQHYRTHLLECANETVKIRLHLVPLHNHHHHQLGLDNVVKGEPVGLEKGGL